jgi:predicted GTPase
MNNSEGLKPFQQSLAGLPQWVSERILQQINQLTRYEPVIGIMGKTGAGKSLCNALFAGDISPVSDVAAIPVKPLRFRLLVGDRYMTLVDCPAWAKVVLAIPSNMRCTANSSPARPGTVAD